MSKIKAKDGRMLTEREEVLIRWKEYVEDLYEVRNRPEKLIFDEESAGEEDNLWPGIFDAEIKRALRDMKARKAMEVDNIS